MEFDPNLCFSFRWVQCQLDYLGTLDRDTARRHALINLPPGLHNTYKRILDAVKEHPDNYKITKTALTWLLYSVRPLSLSELAVAAVVEPETTFNEEHKLDKNEILLKYCGSLLKVDNITSIVELAHFSVTQYLTSRDLDAKLCFPTPSMLSFWGLLY